MTKRRIEQDRRRMSVGRASCAPPRLKRWRWLLFATMARLDAPETAWRLPVAHTIIHSRAVKMP